MSMRTRTESELPGSGWLSLVSDPPDLQASEELPCLYEDHPFIESIDGGAGATSRHAFSLCFAQATTKSNKTLLYRLVRSMDAEGHVPALNLKVSLMPLRLPRARSQALACTSYVRR